MGIHFGQHRIIEAQPSHDAGPEIFDHHVRDRRKFLENLFAFRRFKVDGYGLLACVHCDERNAHQFRIHFRIRAQTPGEISVFRMLDLDDFGSQEYELKAAERSSKDVGYVQHADTMEWKRHISLTLRQNRQYILRDKLNLLSFRAKRGISHFSCQTQREIPRFARNDRVRPFRH